MKKSMTVAITLWTLLGILVVGMIIGGIYLSQRSNSFLNFFNRGGGKQELLLDESYSLEGITSLTLDLTSEEVSIHTIDNDQLEVKHFGNGIKPLEVAKEGSTLTIRRPVTSSFFIFNFQESRVELYLPKSYQEDLSMDIASGEVNFDGDRTFKTLSSDLASGNIYAKKLAADETKIDLASGDIHFDALQTKSYGIDVTSGNIEISDLRGSGKLAATSGNILLDKVVIDDSLSLDLTSGFIHLGLSGDPSLEFKGDVLSGKIDAYFDLYQKDGGNELSAKIGEGPYKKLDIEVTSGTVEITKE